MPSQNPRRLRYQLMIFDFDGTLANSLPFFASHLNAVAARYGFRQVDAHELEQLRHAHPRHIMRHMGVSPWKLPLISSSFIRRMRRHADEIPLFEHTQDNLQHLAAAGVRLAIVSSNSRRNIRAILGDELFGLFDPVYCGMSMFGKKAHLQKLLLKTGIAASQAIYIGDQETDAMAAAAVCMDFAAVSWGFNSVQALARHPHVIQLQHMRQLRDVLSVAQ